MDESSLIARVKDCAEICFKTDAPKFMGFLSENEAAIVEAFLEKSGVKHTFFGGFDLAQRRYLAVLPDWCESADFPIDCITFTFQKAYSLAHRDFLGALMALGISRESVGDILVGSGIAAVFLSGTVAKFVLSELKKVGSVGVEGRLGMPEVLPEVSKKITVRDTVSSLRIDCVTASLAGVSRSTARQMIDEGLVSINSFVCQKPTRVVCAGDNITVRKKGRFTVLSVDGRSKKDRIILVYSKFV